jgi:hypothetical protein
MRIKRSLLPIVFLLAGIGSSFAQKAEGFSFELAPTLNIPIGISASTYSVGAGIELKAIYLLPSMPWFHFQTGINGNLIPIADSDSLLSTFGLSIGEGLNGMFFRKLFVSISVESGICLAMLGSDCAIGGFMQAVVAAAYIVNPACSFGANIDYKHYFGAADPLYTGLGVSLTAILKLDRRNSR